MKPILTFLLLLLATISFPANRSYTIKKTLAEGESSSQYSYYQFPTTSFVNDTIEYGDSVTFNLYVDYNKHVPVAPVLFVLFQKAGTSDSIKVDRTIKYSQVAALANDNLGSLESYYTKTFKSTTSAWEFSTATYYAQYIADSITSAGLAYPGFSLTRSVHYTVTVIPLKSGAAVKVREMRLKLYLQPYQFK
jgi:hypothetical protein